LLAFYKFLKFINKKPPQIGGGNCYKKDVEKNIV